ncbi:MAG: hypothetical protein ACXWC9_07090 [Pseudobdellovibrionaceae bacterium]
MFRVTFSFILLMSTVSMAGTHGGGVVGQKTIGDKISVSGGSGTVKEEYVKYLGNDRGEVVFEYGQANEKNELYTEVVKQRFEEFTPEQQKVVNAIVESKKQKDWKKVD